MKRLPGRTWQLVALGLLALTAVVLSTAAILRSSAPPVVAATPAPTFAPVAADTTATASPSAEALPTAVFVGDRYTAEGQWPQQAGDAAGWNVVNLAAAGIGYRVAPTTCAKQPCTPISGMVATVAQHEPDVVVLVAGEADGDYELAPFAAPTLAAFRQALPNARILVLPPLSAQSPQPYWLGMHTNTLRKVAAEAHVTFVDATAISTAKTSYRDGVLTAEAGEALAQQVMSTVS